jgi:hypothetical protein
MFGMKKTLSGQFNFHSYRFTVSLVFLERGGGSSYQEVTRPHCIKYKLIKIIYIDFILNIFIVVQACI